MKTLSFTYTKKDGSKSDRVLATMVCPSNFYAGTDISELDEVEQGLYLAEMSRIQDFYLGQIAELNEKFDTKHRFRQFDPKLMQIHTTEEI